MTGVDGEEHIRRDNILCKSIRQIARDLHIAAWRETVIQGVDASFQRVPGLWPWLEDLQKRLVQNIRDR